MYKATFEERWYSEAVAIADAMIDRFGDAVRGGFFTTAEDQPHLVARRKDLEDAPTPSGNSAAALGLLRLSRLSGNPAYERQAAGVLALHGPMAARHPGAFGQLLQALDLYMAPSREVALAGPERDLLVRAVRARYRPRLVVAAGPGGQSVVPLLQGRTAVDGASAAYVCERFACQLPVTDVEALTALLDD